MSEPDGKAAERVSILASIAPGVVDLLPILRRLRVSLLYVVFAIPGIILAAAFTALAGRVSDALRFVLDRVPEPGLFVNFLPALVAGFVTYHLVGKYALAHQGDRPPGHFLRSWPLYLGALVCGHSFITGWRTPGFGLVAQLVLWPWMMFTGGILADLRLSLGRRWLHR